MTSSRNAKRRLAALAVAGLMTAAGLSTAPAAAGEEAATSPGPRAPKKEAILQAIPDPAGGAVKTSFGPTVTWATHHDLSLPLRDLARLDTLPPPNGGPAPRRQIPREEDGGGEPDPVAQIIPGVPLMPGTIQNFEGVGNVNGICCPPDTNGDVGPNHYVQWINLSFAIWDKSGNKLLGPVNGNSLWSGFGGPCQTYNDGDPIVLYDQFADRWMMSQFALPGPHYQCIAISQTPDPTGPYYRYAFKISDTKVNDYPKFGVWPDGYYMSVNLFTCCYSWGGAGAGVFERDQMLLGLPARMVFFDLYGVNPIFGGQLPSDFDGLTPPPVGSPNYFVEADDSTWIGPSDALRIWKFKVDWSNPPSSTFGISGQPDFVLPTAPFDPNLCGYSRNCIPQPSGPGLDAISDRLMYRLQYRNFASHETLVTNHSVDVGGDHAGVRWYEIRDPGGSPSIYQQGTYAPDAAHRWMGSAAMDTSGNIAVGYSASSSSVHPAIRYTGRLAGDPPGTLPQGESTLIAGGGSQQTAYGRWGDYSMMAVDPVDDCTFWFTSEYYATSSSSGWRTRIGSFKFPTCIVGPSGTLEGTVVENGTTDPVPNATISASDGTLAYTALTDSTGFYRMKLSPGIYSVTASAPTFTSSSVNGVEILEDETTTQNFALRGQGSIQGTVTDSSTGTPISSAVIVATSGATSQTTTTNSNGFYKVKLPAGVYEVTASHAEFNPKTVTGIAVVDELITLQDFSLTSRGAVQGTVTDHATGLPIGGAQVTASGPASFSGFTNASGFYRIGNMITGTYSLAVSADGYAAQNVPGVAVSDGSTTVMNVSLRTLGIIQGYVKDAVDGAIIVGADVVASGPTPNSTKSDALGFYRFTRLQEGNYQIAATAPGYASGSTGAVAIYGTTTNTDVLLDQAPLVPVTFKVIDGAGGNWPIYARIDVSGPRVPATGQFTNPLTGSKTVDMVPGIDYTVLVTAQTPGYAAQTRTIRPPAGGGLQTFPLLLAPTGCSAPGHGPGPLHETFSGGSIPSGWSVLDGRGNGQVWRFDDPGGRGNQTGGSGGFAIVDSDNYGFQGSQDTILLSPSANLSALSQVYVEFDHDLRYSGGEIADVDVSINGGAVWVNKWRLTANKRKAHEKIDISSYAAGKSNVKIRFRYYNASWDWWWQVDNVILGGSCVATGNATVVGHVRDSFGAPLNGALVTDDLGNTAKAFATPNDAALDDGIYVLGTTSGGRGLTADLDACPGYTAASQVAGVTAGEGNAYHFVLNSPEQAPFREAIAEQATAPDLFGLATSSSSSSASALTGQISVEAQAAGFAPTGTVVSSIRLGTASSSSNGRAIHRLDVQPGTRNLSLTIALDSLEASADSSATLGSYATAVLTAKAILRWIVCNPSCNTTSSKTLTSEVCVAGGACSTPGELVFNTTLSGTTAGYIEVDLGLYAQTEVRGEGEASASGDATVARLACS